MKRPLLLVGLLLVILCIVLGVGVAITREKLRCDVNTLVLAEGEMPEDWNLVWEIQPPALPRLGSRRAYGVFMQNGDETAHHTVYEYSNRTLAVLHITVENQTFFPSIGWNWRELEGTRGMPLCADQREIRCGDSDDPYLGSRCTAILRYGPYVSDFSSSVQEGVLSIEEFKQIVLKIDGQLCQCRN